MVSEVVKLREASSYERRQIFDAVQHEVLKKSFGCVPKPSEANYKDWVIEGKSFYFEQIFRKTEEKKSKLGRIGFRREARFDGFLLGWRIGRIKIFQAYQHIVSGRSGKVSEREFAKLFPDVFHHNEILLCVKEQKKHFPPLAINRRMMFSQ